LSPAISSATFSLISVEFCHPSGSSSVVETTYFFMVFIWAANGFSWGSCPGQKAAHSS
jgi:hypothetical protein